uniref:Peptidase C1A papain C-terminal domain-containing protein n=1 Tax=Amphimedon queenslandica TaxID=400682 RepID=A0A1X7V349_AMPQE
MKVLNSWGSDWGDKGYFYMPYQFIENSFFCFDFWKITFACERGKPRPDDTVPCTDSSGSCGIKSQLYHPPYHSGGAYVWYPPSFGGTVLSGEPSGYVEYPLPNSSTSGPGHCQVIPSPSSSLPPPPNHTSGAYGSDAMNTAVEDSKLYT